ncbi:SdpI family protein [Epilithonimonas zeae]|uniref:SdpI family protein n=1 Tax=Epilithonimonas zeae TaxID=1416779 RepID=UPI00200FF886|nr:SdpI family protein [Epilithonimonas zeae]UQB69434.1 SdpI family protein [Epilithonimonas zeae]
MIEKLMLSPNIIGFIFILAGLIQMIFPPKKINSLYGYRTPRSMKNIEVWNFAQKLSSKILILIGFFLILFGIIALFLGLQEVLINSVGIGLMLLFAIILFFYMESAIKKKFP